MCLRVIKNILPCLRRTIFHEAGNPSSVWSVGKDAAWRRTESGWPDTKLADVVENEGQRERAKNKDATGWCRQCKLDFLILDNETLCKTWFSDQTVELWLRGEVCLRRKGKLMRINCAALWKILLEVKKLATVTMTHAIRINAEIIVKRQESNLL